MSQKSSETIIYQAKLIVHFLLKYKNFLILYKYISLFHPETLLSLLLLNGGYS